MFFTAARDWSNAYAGYTGLLADEIRSIKQAQLHTYPFISSSSHPMLAKKDLLHLLRLPVNHLQHLSRNFKTLLDNTPDEHPDVKAIVELISTLNRIWEICSMNSCWDGTNLQIEELKGDLSWSGFEDNTMRLNDPRRKLIHMGGLHIDSVVIGARRNPDDPIKTASIFVILLDNCRMFFFPFLIRVNHLSVS